MEPQNKDNEIEISYPNAKTALAEIHIAYEVENERKRTLDGKAGAFMAANIAVLTVYIPLIPFDKMLSFFAEAGRYKVVAATLILVVLAVGIVFSLAAFKKLADGYSNKRYRYPNVDNLLGVANTIKKYPDGATESGIVAHYHSILRGTIDEPGNMKLNDERADKIQKGIHRTVAGFCLISFATIAIRIIMGG